MLSSLIVFVTGVLSALCLFYKHSQMLPALFAGGFILLILYRLELFAVTQCFGRGQLRQRFAALGWVTFVTFLTTVPGPMFGEDLNSNYHIVFGDGVFDGEIDASDTFTTAIHGDLRRLFLVSALHPEPKEVLQIAMAAGMWTKILAGYAPIDHLDVIELNPGYLRMAQHYPEYDVLVNNPKVSLHFDDGRRWLGRHPEKKYDLIIFNTPHHFRSLMSNLLSKEFIGLVKRHLKPGGVYYQTITDSEDALFTGTKNFTTVAQLENMYAASDSPINVSAQDRKKNLGSFKYRGQNIFRDGNQNEAMVSAILSATTEDIGEPFRSRKDLTEVTDDNMLTEFKKPRSRLSDLYRMWEQD